MSDPDGALSRDLQRMLGSKELAKRVHESFVKLRGGAGGDQLAEMARDLLDGRIDIRAVTRSDAYAEPLSDAALRYKEWFGGLDPEEQAAVMENARAELTRLENDESDRPSMADPEA
ncbi:hypothetical protein AB0M20_00405 [Actinoplanes sp. NPDC051633]|uniref:hypothetical protein n=1 Tax=Actinoplanes sp. NPDC051633 TaxID=3155670 RepID=UPI003427A72B